MNPVVILRELQSMGMTIEQAARVFKLFGMDRNVKVTRTVTDTVTERNAMSNAERARKWRQTHKKRPETVTETVTDRRNNLSSLTVTSLETIEEAQEENSEDAREAEIVAAFAEFRREFPKRNGSQSWAKAQKSYRRFIAQGVDPQVMNNGARTYRTECERNGKTGTEFVTHAVTWINGERWNDVQEEGSNGSWDDRFAAALRRQADTGHH